MEYLWTSNSPAHLATPRPKSVSSRSLFVGLDFGTMYSGMSFVDPRDEITTTITDWPGRLSPTAFKTPSAIVFGQDAGADRWGFNVLPDNDAHRLVKLALLHPDQRPKVLRVRATSERSYP